jgi:phosphonate transport system substrate-binding protein
VLRLVTFLSPSIPFGLFAAVADRLRAELGIAVELACDETCSGPTPGRPNPFADGRADLGFVCASSYLALRAEDPASVVLVGAAAVHDDPRNGGEPIYHAELVVRAGAPETCFADLEGAHFVYNDSVSLSGWLSVLDRIAEGGFTRELFASVTPSGSHLDSLRLVAEGQADCAAIDSNAYRLAPERRRQLRVLESLGPYPVQPVVARAGLDPEIARAARDALLSLPAEALAPHGVTRYAAVDESHYLPLLCRLERARAVWGA